MGLHRQYSTSVNDTIPIAIHNNVSNNLAIVNQQNATNNAKNLKKFSLIQVFVPSFVLVAIALFVSTVFILESDSELFGALKNIPEMVSLKYQYYQPFKMFLARKLGYSLN